MPAVERNIKKRVSPRAHMLSLRERGEGAWVWAEVQVETMPLYSSTSPRRRQMRPSSTSSAYRHATVWAGATVAELALPRVASPPFSRPHCSFYGVGCDHMVG